MQGVADSALSERFIAQTANSRASGGKSPVINSAMPALPIVIFLACFAAGGVAAARWLLSLPPGRTGGLVFLVVTGMRAAALALVGLHVYSIVHELNHSGDHNEEAEIIAGGLRNLLWQAGTIFGLACAIFLLAPPLEEVDEPESE